MENLGREVLRQVEVRPAQREERGRCDAVMHAQHYLGMRGMVGESLRYVAESQGEWVALLGWSAAALKCGARDRWIGLALAASGTAIGADCPTTRNF